MLSIILSTMMIMILVRYVLLERKELEFSIFANADHDMNYISDSSLRIFIYEASDASLS